MLRLRAGEGSSRQEEFAAVGAAGVFEHGYYTVAGQPRRLIQCMALQQMGGKGGAEQVARALGRGVDSGVLCRQRLQ